VVSLSRQGAIEPPIRSSTCFWLLSSRCLCYSAARTNSAFCILALLEYSFQQLSSTIEFLSTILFGYPTVPQISQVVWSCSSVQFSDSAAGGECSTPECIALPALPIFLNTQRRHSTLASLSNTPACSQERPKRDINFNDSIESKARSNLLL
jgi:hypothetical protein